MLSSEEVNLPMSCVLLSSFGDVEIEQGVDDHGVSSNVDPLLLRFGLDSLGHDYCQLLVLAVGIADLVQAALQDLQLRFVW